MYLFTYTVSLVGSKLDYLYKQSLNELPSKNGFNDCILPTVREGREGNVFTSVCHSVYSRPHGYSVTAHPCYSAIGTHLAGILSCLYININS